MAVPDVLAVAGCVQHLAAEEISRLWGVRDEVKLLKDELQRLLGFLEDADAKQRKGNGSVSIWIRQIREAAYDSKNIIEVADYMRKRNRLTKGFMGAISRYARLPSDWITFHNVAVEIKRVRRKISEICESANRLGIVDLGAARVAIGHVGDGFQEDCGVMYESVEDDVTVVGFYDDYQKVVETLVDQVTNIKVVSIIGTGGIGKTTLARKVCNSPQIKDHFDKIAWVTVSQRFQGIYLLRSIMKQIMGPINDTDKMQDYEVGKKIHDFLLQKRYLVVLDDVWKTDTWEQINKKVKVFPDSKKGSRVILTTRKEDVANHINMPTYVHTMEYLDDEKSWELFSSKALPSYKRSQLCGDVDEFEELGRKIAKKCKGLPLALAVLGGYLSKNLNIESWKDTLLGWTSIKDGEMMGEILARSYDDLPNPYLKSCFLYFAAFPEDYRIYVANLIELWIAEGFVEHRTGHSLEQTARTYVTELAQRSLVQVVHKSRVHACIERIRIHDILHDWCISRAIGDGFLDIVDKSSDQEGASSSSTMTYCRTSFQNFCHDETLQEAANLRSLLGFGVPSISLSNLKFVRVLHVEDTRLKNFSRTIGGLIHLRCLRLRRCEQVTMPYSIGQLLSLQTIDLRDTPLGLGVPSSMWDIPSLRYVYIGTPFSLPRNGKQKGIRTLSINFPEYVEYSNNDLVTLMCQMTQLTTFHLDLRHIPAEVIKSLPKMSQVVEIYLDRFNELKKLPELPESLEELVLIAKVLKKDPMPVLEKLPKLKVLRLEGYEGETMSCSANSFKGLKELELKWFAIKEWRMEIGTMPKLSYLTLRRCEHINRLPEGLLHLPSIKELKLEGMRQISSDEGTYQELQRKGCKVTEYS